MNRVTTLEVEFDFGSGFNKIYPVILNDENEMIMIDCGYPHFMPIIKAAAEKKGINLDGRLTKIIITHHDFDHIGALAEFKNAYFNLEVVSSAIEEKYISGKEKSLRLQQAEALYDSLPESEKPEAENFHRMLSSIKPAAVDLIVEDKDILPYCGGIEIVATPGHMPGHISLYLKESKTLVAGDALVVENGKLGIANPKYTLDMDGAKESIKKMLGYDIERIICYHGGMCTKDIKASLKSMLNK